MSCFFNEKFFSISDKMSTTIFHSKIENKKVIHKLRWYLFQNLPLHFLTKIKIINEMVDRLNS